MTSCTSADRSENDSTPSPGQVEGSMFEVPDVTLYEKPVGEVLVGAWELVEVRDEAREVVLRYHAEIGCSRFAGVLVEELDNRVVLAPIAVKDPPDGPGPQFCPGDRTDGVGFVRLAAPLGDRMLEALPADF